MQQPYADLISIQEASEWASRLLNREVAPTNISYLIQYGKIKKYGNNNGQRNHIDKWSYFQTSRNFPKIIGQKAKT